MPPTDRNANKDYAIFLIRDNVLNCKILDVTTDSNKRNYKFSILKSLKDGTEKKHPVNQLFKDSDPNTIIFDVLDTYNGTYAQALDYMSKIAEKHNIKTTRTIDNDILAIQEQIKQEKQEAQTQTPTQIESVSIKQNDKQSDNKPTKKTKPQKVLDTPPILEVVELPPLTDEKTKPMKKVIKKIPIEEPTEEQAKKISEAIKTPIKAVKAVKAPPPPIEEDEDEEPTPAPTPIKKETKARVAQRQRLISECETLHAIYNELNESVFKAKQRILMKQEELKTEYDYNLKLV